MNPEQAELLAIHMLTYLADSPSVLELFLDQSGLEVSELAAQSQNADFLAGVIDFFLSDEVLLLDFCEAEGIEPTAPARARMSLPGANEFYS